MRRFSQQVLATTLGFFLALGLLVGLTLSSAVWFGSQPKPDKLADPTVLRIELSGKLVEYVSRDPLPALVEKREQLIDLVALKAAIKNAQKDPHIKGIYLSVKQLIAGWASLAEVREALQAFKATGKFVIAYSEAYTQKTFYLASLADEVMAHPAGIFLLNGLSLAVLFYKGLLEKLEVEPQVFVAGQYKSAAEPLVRSAMSEASKHQYEVLLSTLYDHLIDKIATDRGLSATSLRQMVNDLAIKDPQEAHAAQLITKVGYADDAEAWMKTKLGLAERDAVTYVSLNKYIKVNQVPKSPKTQVAVLVASGSITDDPAQPGSISTQTFVRDLKRLREDPQVKAIVLRINSPGGSMLASDTMRRELMLTRACKPIVASLGDVATSGGYYLALACDYIIAHPTTITGSVGVFGLYFTIDSLLSNKLGITVDGVKTAPSADLLSMTRPPSAHEKDVIQRMVDQAYTQFVALVSTSRQMSPAEAERVSGGRVWPASLAQEHGLVDELGSLENAIEKAADLASLAGAYTVSYYPPASTWLEEALNLWSDMQGKMLVDNTYHQVAPYLQNIRQLHAMRGIQAWLPYAIEID
ncbi:MAG: signal peptide peptidase SppA [Bacteroidota bacterium]